MDRQLYPFLRIYRHYGWRILLGIALSVITLLASIGLLALSGWFLTASALAGVAGLYSLNYMLPAAGIRAAAILRTVGRYGERLVSHDTTFRALQQLRQTVLQKIIPLSPAGLTAFRQSDLLTRLVSDIDTLDQLYLRVISPLISAFIVTVLCCFTLSYFSYSLALLLTAMMLLSFIGLSIYFHYYSRPVGQQLIQQRAQYRQQLLDWLQGMAELLIFQAESRFRQDYQRTEQQWQQYQQRQMQTISIAQASMTAITGVALVLVIIIAAKHFTAASVLVMIALMVFATLALFEALTPAITAFHHLGQVSGAAQRVNQLLNSQPLVDFPQQAVTLATDQPVLTFQQVSFAYPTRQQPVLSDINLTLKPGEQVALLGKTGCGKSTLLQLISRAWDAGQGQIYVYGNPIQHYPEAQLRQLMSVVPQRIHLFNATLRDNLLLAQPNASDQQLIHLLKQLRLEHLLTGAGLDSWLNDGGRLLSGGEQRRLGIARALLHDSAIIVLDEPTEGLDSETERHIFALLRQYSQGKTLLMVTHRLYGLEQLDKLYIMEQGQIIEQGSHQQLLSQRGRYYQLRHPALPLMSDICPASS